MFKKIVLILTLFYTAVYGFMPDDQATSFTLGADWLYWKAFQENMQYASQVTIMPNENIIIDSTVLSPPFDPKSGFRLFATYNSCNNPWAFNADFVHLFSNANNSNSIPPGTTNSFIVLNNQTFPVLNAVVSNNIQFTNLDSFFDLKFNYFDLDFIYTFYPCSFIKFTPNLGIRGMWIKENFELHGISPVGGGTIFVSNFLEHFDGYGLEGGFTTELDLGCRFSLVGSLGGSILYAKIKVDESFSLTTSEYMAFVMDGITFDVDPFFELSVNEHDLHPIPTFHTFFGINYSNFIFCHPFDLHIGWEQHVIVNANHLSLLDYSNLTLQGLTLGGNFVF